MGSKEGRVGTGQDLKVRVGWGGGDVADGMWEMWAGGEWCGVEG